MPGLTDQQQAYITIAAEVLQSISLLTIPPVLTGSLPPWVPVVLFLCGAASKGLMQFKGSTPQQQQATIDATKAGLAALKPLVQKFMAMTPQEQQAVLASLPQTLPLLEALLGAQT